MAKGYDILENLPLLDEAVNRPDGIIMTKMKYEEPEEYRRWMDMAAKYKKNTADAEMRIKRQEEYVRGGSNLSSGSSGCMIVVIGVGILFTLSAIQTFLLF